MFATLLPNIRSPNDIKHLSHAQLHQLAHEIRKKIIEVVGHNGGHLSSNLGVVELTIALHRVFDSPTDAIIWDVSHQCYAHKLLTGRYNRFDTLRKMSGLSGFTKKSESCHDFFDVGHSSTSISSGLGLLVGRCLQKQEGQVIAVIGDGALTGGMAMEALFHAGQISKNLIIVLNDNQMSIGKNTGSLSRYLSRLTMSSPYQSFRYRIDLFVSKIPIFSSFLTRFIFRFKRALKAIFFPTNLFVELGFEYVGPLNGHNISELETIFKRVKKINRPVVVHVVTKKGKGYSPAENDPSKFHGIGPFCISDGAVERYDTLSFTEAFSSAIISLASVNPKITAITAAMTKGTGLNTFSHRFPTRFFDVGIAEQHAVTFAGGLAKSGMIPITAIYSTFIQRAIDQIIEDIALQNSAAVFVMDRAGAVPGDGETHQGVFDIALLRPIPNILLLAPASALELENMLRWAVSRSLPVFIRYPKASCPSEQNSFSLPIQEGRGVLVPCSDFAISSVPEKTASLLFVCTGGIFPEVLTSARSLLLQNIYTDIYNLRFIKPIDCDFFLSIAKQYKAIIFVEDGIVTGGIGFYLNQLVAEFSEMIKTAVLGFPDKFVAQGNRREVLESVSLSSSNIIEVAKKLLGN